MSETNRSRRDFWIPFLSTLVALAGVLSGSLASYRESVSRLEVARFDHTFALKYEGYVKFMQAIGSARRAADDRDLAALNEAFHEINDTLFSLEPFLGEARKQAHPDVRALREHLHKVYYEQFGAAGKTDASQPVSTEQLQFEHARDAMNELIYTALFDTRP
jgi:hypothetical protein